MSSLTGSGLQCVEQVQFNFVSDGVASSFVVDLTQPPIRMSFAGNMPTAIRNPVLSNTQSVAQPTVTAEIVGQEVQFTFSAPPPMLDGNNNPVLYTLSSQLVY